MYGLRSVINALVAVLIFPSLIQAQASAGVTGVVEDETRAAIAGAKITLLGQDGGAVRSTTCKPDGGFVIEDLSPARYVLTVEMSGFETYQKAVAVGPQPLKLRIGLRVKGVEEDVTVEGESADKVSTSANDATMTKLDGDSLR